MFEYLMPALVLRTFPSTLLSQTHHGAVKRHIAYGAERGVPWGISESAYNVRDRIYTYQYRAFGVPDLALKRGLSRDLVIAPYATRWRCLSSRIRQFATSRISRPKARSGHTDSAMRSTIRVPSRDRGKRWSARTWRTTSA